MIPVNTHARMRGAIAAQRIGVFAHYVDQMFRHLWAQPKNTARSVERGTFGAPRFFAGEDIYFGKDRLRDVEKAIMESGK